MEIVKGILVVLHLVGFGAVFGSTLAQLSLVKEARARITPGILHGANLLFVTGLLLVASLYMLGGSPNNVKIGVKTLVLIAIIVVILVNRKKDNVSGGVLGAIAGLSLVNVALAVLWN
ncbi:hypothetical protein [Leucobacter luti]|uniref:Integral membrane protein n=1 Tax=Leucobacter luti TaxID=340320 RepID=A0A4R6S402_9MICO|nr:hypothetical protein [Leucobacter luti]MCW2287180.1 Ca2+/Na+ antiporter [Leucobacter luti]QYM76734.1 hypothetical protein K1X41_04830 [Leucobacter luti]TCK41406.1 hypothetical protein EDF60_1832 [Leucobacter luti]TDP94380.1 hypothetical protein EDF62_0795 [Leucobacter luti]